MTTTNTKEKLKARERIVTGLEGAGQTATRISAAVTEGGRAYLGGLLEIGRTLGSIGQEVLVDAGRHLRNTVEAKSIYEVAELQAAWAQSRVETSTTHARELVDLTRAKADAVIAPFTALIDQKAA